MKSIKGSIVLYNDIEYRGICIEEANDILRIRAVRVENLNEEVLEDTRDKFTIILNNE